MARRRGGYQRPSNPAPVSGPGALSERTDGGPSQPIREIPGGQYGDRQANAELQASAPMAVQGGPQQQAGGQPAPAPAAAPLPDLTGPTTMPQRPVQSRLGSSAFAQAEQQALLKMMYGAYPHPSLARLLPETDV